MGIARWNPESRAGAVAVKASASTDTKATERMANVVRDWAKYQDLSGDTDSAETVTVQGTYDWRAYLHEAAEQARREQKPAKKVERAPAVPAPTVFYA